MKKSMVFGHCKGFHVLQFDFICIQIKPNMDDQYTKSEKNFTILSVPPPMIKSLGVTTLVILLSKAQNSQTSIDVVRSPKYQWCFCQDVWKIYCIDSFDWHFRLCSTLVDYWNFFDVKVILEFAVTRRVEEAILESKYWWCFNGRWIFYS